MGEMASTFFWLDESMSVFYLMCYQCCDFKLSEVTSQIILNAQFCRPVLKMTYQQLSRKQCISSFISSMKLSHTFFH